MILMEVQSPWEREPCVCDLIHAFSQGRNSCCLTERCAEFQAHVDGYGGTRRARSELRVTGVLAW